MYTLCLLCSEKERKTSISSPIAEVGTESAIRAMESLIQSNFGRASPSRKSSEESSAEESPNALLPGCRSRSVPAKGEEEARSGGCVGARGGSNRPSSAVAQRQLSPTDTPRRAGTPSIAVDDVHVDDHDRARPGTLKTSPLVLPVADSSTFSAACPNHDDDFKEQPTSRLEKDLRVGDDAATTNGSAAKRRASELDDLSGTDAKRRHMEDRQQKRLMDPADDDRPTSTSGRLTALESLQGFVYRQTASSEHPLDSLQRLIYGGSGSSPSHVSVQLAGSHSSATAADSDQFQAGRSPVLAPQTLILVNPIVTVVSQGGGGSEVPSTPKPAAPTGSGRGSAGESSGSSEDAGEQAVPAPRVYHCRACRRKFSSKGSYRYHLSRCHVLASAASPKAACEAPPRPKYHQTQHHRHHHHRHHRDDDDVAVATSEPSSDVSISAGSAFGGCAPLEDGGRRLPAQHFAEAK